MGGVKERSVIKKREMKRRNEVKKDMTYQEEKKGKEE